MRLFAALFSFCAWLWLSAVPVAANEPDAHAGAHHAESPKGFNVKETLFHHVQETHDWHITDIPLGNGHYLPIEIPLPWILYSAEKGLDVFFLSSHDHHAFEQGVKARGYALDHHAIKKTLNGVPVYDFSLSKTPIQMILVAVVMILVFGQVAAGYRKNAGRAPKGIQALFEPVIIFVRDEVAKPNLHGKHDAFMPYLLTLFFFIWFSNILGLMPFNSNIAGNISVTCALAVLTFLITQFNGTKDYWMHILWAPGVPTPVKLILTPVELIGIFTKPFSLMIRLFANIAGGHFMVLSLISLIFIVGKAGQAPAGAFAIMPLSLAFSLFIMLIECLVAAVQAYVFTLLTCVAIGAALETHDHHHDESHHQAEAH
jgi:F-type H+-transporting ATPase subunit a